VVEGHVYIRPLERGIHIGNATEEKLTDALDALIGGDNSMGSGPHKVRITIEVLR
jgi:hypothetical protein